MIMQCNEAIGVTENSISLLERDFKRNEIQFKQSEQEPTPHNKRETKYVFRYI